MGGIKDVVDDLKFEAWLRVCANMTPESKRKRLSQIEGSRTKRDKDRERERRFREEEDERFKVRCREDDEPIMPDCGHRLPSERAFGRRGREDHE